jgi:PAS domain S-box-containing protein
MSMLVLHLEDDRYDYELVSEALRSEGFDAEIVRADSEADFVDALQTRSFDLILADYSLPQYDGFSALNRARSISPTTPFIFVSGTLGEELAVETLKRGATDYVVKQRIERLGPSVRRALREVEETGRRKEAEKSLRRSEQRFRELADAMPQLVWTATSSGVIDYYNQRYLEFSEPASKDVRTLPGLIINPDDLDRTIEAWDFSFQSGSVYEVEHRILRASGTYYWYLSRAVPIQDDHGVVVRWYGTTTEIHALKEAEEHLIKSQHSLAAANATKDRFLAILSHELRTPLNPVLLATSELKNDETLPGTVRTQLAEMQRNLELEARLIDDLLDLTRVANKKLQIEASALNLHHVIQDSVHILKSEIDAKKISVSLELGAVDPIITGDRVRLQQVMWNLLSNSIKSVSEGGRVTVSSIGTTEGDLLITISDNGTGIEPRQLQTIFEPFHQEEKLANGSDLGIGLGLAICKYIVELHGGTITAYSGGSGQGAEFRLRLPRRKAEEPASKLLEPEKAMGRTQALRILLVEDHIPTANVLTRLLLKRGYDVLHAASAGAAIALCETHAFDLLVTDIGLPDRSGVEVIREAKERWNLEAIAISGFGAESDFCATQAAGCQIHLVKPISIEKLDAAIAKLRKSAATGVENSGSLTAASVKEASLQPGGLPESSRG